jgi:hypothetical protein
MSISYLLCDKSEECNNLFVETPMSDIAKQFRIIWSEQDLKSVLNLQETPSAPSVIVYDTLSGNHVIYEGDEFKTYWGTYKHTHYYHENNFINQIHSNTLILQKQLQDSVKHATASIRRSQALRSMQTDDQLTDALHSRLSYHMSQHLTQPSDDSVQKIRPFTVKPHIPSESSQVQLINRNLLQNQLFTQHRLFQTQHAMREEQYALAQEQAKQAQQPQP